MRRFLILEMTGITAVGDAGVIESGAREVKEETVVDAIERHVN